MPDSKAMPFPDADAQSRPAGESALWRRVRRWALPVLGLVVLGLLLSHAHKVDWAGAWQALGRYSPGLLLAALALCTASHALYGCYDLIGRHHTRHGLPRWRSWAIAITSYAFNLNLGSLVGGVAMRARLYARAGIDEATVAQIVGLSLATNWLGYGLVAGCVFASGVVKPPAESPLGEGAFRALGVLMLLLAATYVLACAKAQGRQWQVRGRRVQLPSARLALVQLGLSAANWALMASAMYLLLGGKVPYAVTLGVMLAAAIAGVVTPIPAGLGVLEAVYLALLSGSVRQGVLMGALLAYRALYYLVPLGGGLVLYLLLERYASAHPPAEGGGTDALSPPPPR
ncbi:MULTISPECIES: lysylphosphatidylglycerol synthase domain-containing protein [unclassified Variovorax]|uniref:lysylphosphatidylglycerol synthase domain-containing protein n=1 Tax=unclassified Variovorax TaxID=663243 RepID=UPI000AC66014|nr:MULTISPECIES: lysylphosphatidylglycerol synthase domain-containing protein [unclassified Variovorax]PNG46676.1 Inner membrane protein YbhN [Variovorax sp. B2]PNG48673.1 Inner membrane protein YbhN [Variovorax sp. B4]VTV14462.1 Inner membrane protein YbhN [Variovorax sp. WDL1]